ncbi:hypothetical protein C0991_006385 [Blastosporella zonata]|nr:hypothetical protein C0991_006385 [Blastosporella zonata]
MAPKRKDGSGEELTGREKKKIKMTAARTIAVQPVKTVSFSENAVAGSSSRLAVNRDKLWLETHIWHAKRMKMENMWGYRLAVHPTEKSYRPSHRASVHGSIIHDASYHSVIELKGTEAILKRILDMSCDPNGPSPGSKRYTAGSRVLETYIYTQGSYPFGLISPITVIWKALPLNSASTADPSEEEGQQDVIPATVESKPAAPKRKRKGGKGKEKAENQEAPAYDPETIRVVWLMSHPSAYQDVLSSIQTSASLTLEAVRCENEGEEVEVEIADLRDEEEVVEDGPEMWLLRGSDVPSVISNISKMFNPGAGLLLEVNKLRAKRGHDPLNPTIKADDLMKRALVSVRIKICKRGALEDLAIIYKVADDEAKRWEKTLRNVRGVDEEETEEEIQLSEIVPPETSIIGYVTTGHFSLSQGQCFAIGAVPLQALLELQEQSEK